MKLFTQITKALLITLIVPIAHAQAYPERPVKMVVPFPAGSATDVGARIIGEHLQEHFHKAFVIENKPGALGSIGAQIVARSAPDGYTLLFSSNAIASTSALMKNLPYDPLKDLAPVAGIAESFLVLMVAPTFPAKTLEQFLAYAKENPDKLTGAYGSSTAQVSIALLNKLAGLKTLPVPYKGIPATVTDVIGGTVDFTFADQGSAKAQSDSGRLRAIAITSLKRNPLVPDLPAIAEVAPGYGVAPWLAIMGPANLPKSITEELNGAVNKALQDPEVKKKFAAIGLVPMQMPPKELKSFLEKEVALWKTLAKDANIEPQ